MIPRICRFVSFYRIFRHKYRYIVRNVIKYIFITFRRHRRMRFNACYISAIPESIFTNTIYFWTKLYAFKIIAPPKSIIPYNIHIDIGCFEFFTKSESILVNYSHFTFISINNNLCRNNKIYDIFVTIPSINSCCSMSIIIH